LSGLDQFRILGMTSKQVLFGRQSGLAAFNRHLVPLRSLPGSGNDSTDSTRHNPIFHELFPGMENVSIVHPSFCV
jgi:hypothetical protein